MTPQNVTNEAILEAVRGLAHLGAPAAAGGAAVVQEAGPVLPLKAKDMLEKLSGLMILERPKFSTAHLTSFLLEHGQRLMQKHYPASDQVTAEHLEAYIACHSRRLMV